MWTLPSGSHADPEAAADVADYYSSYQNMQPPQTLERPHRLMQAPPGSWSASKTDQLLLLRQQRAAAVAAAAAAAAAAANSAVNPATVKNAEIGGGTPRGLRCLWAGWVLMCWLSGMCAAAGFLLPYWLKGSRSGSGQTSDLGLFRLCVYPAQAPDGTIELALDCSHYQHFMNIPSPCWRASFVLMSTACCLLLLLTFFLAFSGFRLAVLRIRQVVGVCAAAQGLSAFCIILACILYPAGWRSNPEVSQVCGMTADAFNPGHCHLGWAYVLACAGGFLSGLTVVFPAQLAQHYPERLDHPAWQQQDQLQRQHQLQYQRLHQQQHQHQLYLQAPPQPPSQRQTMISMGHLLGCYPTAAADGRFGYVSYHSMQQLPQQQHSSASCAGSRPPSVCTYASTAECCVDDVVQLQPAQLQQQPEVSQEQPEQQQQQQQQAEASGGGGTVDDDEDGSAADADLRLDDEVAAANLVAAGH